MATDEEMRLNLKKLEKAINDKTKIHLQMVDTAVDKFILFHPYAIVKDPFNDRLECFGYMEMHYEGSNNYWRIPVLEGIKTVEVLNDHFQIGTNWEQELKKFQPSKEVLKSIG